jgi:hypothetical protein
MELDLVGLSYEDLKAEKATATHKGWIRRPVPHSISFIASRYVFVPNQVRCNGQQAVGKHGHITPRFE